MDELDISKVKPNDVAGVVERFVLNNQYRTPLIIIGSKTVRKTVFYVLEEHDFKFRLDGEKIIVTE